VSNTYARSSRYKVTFDGQSFNIIPAPTFPATLMANFPQVARYNPSQGSTPWDDLAARAAQDVWPYGTRADVAILIMNGGTSDVLNGDSGTELYNEQVRYAQAARAAGYDAIFTTTICPSVGFGAGQNTNRIAGNNLLLGNADGAFDGVADVGGDPRMQSPGTAPYYWDGTHPSAPPNPSGIGVEVELFLPFLQQWIK
jgi:hypothetical protein